MRYQSKKFTCGPAAICNAMLVYGEYYQEDDLTKECKTTPLQGTSEAGVIAGIKFTGRQVEVHKGRDSLTSVMWVDTSIRLGTPVILCVDKWGHWVTVIGAVGDKYLVADSANDRLILPYTSLELVDRWNYDSRYYGIAVI